MLRHERDLKGTWKRPERVPRETWERAHKRALKRAMKIELKNMSSGGGGFLLTWYTFVTPSIIINVKYNANLIKVTNDTCYQKRYVYYVLLLSNSLCTFTLLEWFFLFQMYLMLKKFNRWYIVNRKNHSKCKSTKRIW